MSLLDRPTLDDHEPWDAPDPWDDQPAIEETSEDVSDAATVASAEPGNEPSESRSFLQTLLMADDVVIDINENRVDLADRPTLVVAVPTTDETQTGIEAAPEATSDVVAAPVADSAPRPRSTAAKPRTVRGLQLRRVRLRSVIKVSLVFFAVAYASLVGASVLLWNGAQRVGAISSAEGAITNALGSDSFAISGQTLFDVVTIGAGVICLLGLVITILLAVVYNVTGMLFGGLAFETAPLRGSRTRSSS